MDHDTMMTMTSSATMTGTAPMASATMDMSGSSSSPSTMMTSADMAMVFFQSATTPLYSLDWTPTSEGSYAGTCIFLIMLGIAHRILVALRSALLYSKSELEQVIAKESFANEEAYRNSPESVGNRLRSHWTSHPFKVATETTRAVLEVIISGFGYLLMLAVMTMNVGYFLSVLGGIFLGTFIAGRFELGHGSH
ncbi:Ctr copper transporter family-domain-containing protein [Biscogniauxia mediterranea]|nr:Ctr copper transporter family-domain-containing protein [Biscogniauxia mediterranea]